jgi:hypothetical protein
MMESLARSVTRRPWLVLVAAMGLEIAVYLAVQGDFTASDPLAYAVIAHDISEHPARSFAAPSNHPFEMRIGLTVPLALLYRMVGVSTPVTNLPCLAAWLLILWVVYAAAPTPRAKLLALGYVVTCRQLVAHAIALNVDLPCAALMAWSVLALQRRDRRRGAWWVVAAVVAWFAAFLVKETALWGAPVWLYAIAADLRAAGWRATGRRYVGGLAVGVAMTLGYLGLCAVVWRDPMARFAGIEALSREHSWSLSGRPTREWIERLLWGPPKLLYVMFRLTLAPALLGLVFARGRERLWVVATMSMLLLYWFGSSSASPYSPLPLSSRMMLPVLPGLLVLAALGSDALLDRLSPRWRAVFWVVWFAALVLPAAVSTIAKIRRPRIEAPAYAALAADLAELPAARHLVLVCGDRGREALSRYSFAFAPPANLTIVFAGDFARGPRPVSAEVRAMIRTGRAAFPAPDREYDRDAELEAQATALALPALITRRDVTIYDAGDGAALWSAMHAKP